MTDNPDRLIDIHIAAPRSEVQSCQPITQGELGAPQCSLAALQPIPAQRLLLRPERTGISCWLPGSGQSRKLRFLPEQVPSLGRRHQSPSIDTPTTRPSHHDRPISSDEGSPSCPPPAGLRQPRPATRVRRRLCFHRDRILRVGRHQRHQGRQPRPPRPHRPRRRRRKGRLQVSAAAWPVGRTRGVCLQGESTHHPKPATYADE